MLIISQHLTTIFNDGELTREATIKKYLIVQQEGISTISFSWRRRPDIKSSLYGIQSAWRRRKTRSGVTRRASRGLSSRDQGARRERSAPRPVQRYSR